jgi:hypothetical protein
LIATHELTSEEKIEKLRGEFPPDFVVVPSHHAIEHLRFCRQVKKGPIEGTVIGWDSSDGIKVHIAGSKRGEWYHKIFWKRK